MGSGQAAAAAGTLTSSEQLYVAIGHFLNDQRLSPNPANYTFAYHVIAEPDGALARTVSALTEGGVRLTARDIGALGVEADPSTASVATRPASNGDFEHVVARTQMQVEGFEDMVRTMHNETRDFGENLAASAQTMRERHDSGSSDAHDFLEEVAMLTATMMERVHRAESRLDQARKEARELRSKLEEARDNARRDPLTELPNRRAFEEAYAAHSASGNPIVLAVCDVDHFKSVNDRFGHAVGDRVLRAIANALRSECAGHLVARHGGEEFAVLFSGIDRARAHAILENARKAVAAKRYRLRETDAPLGEVTFSAGLVEARGGEEGDDVFQRADALLYRAKESGRNQICTEW